MRRLLLGAGAVALVAVGGLGCGHVEATKAEYHEAKAERAAEHGHYNKAAKEDYKARKDEAKAATAPLP